MVFVVLMFVFGAWDVQQLAQLPSMAWLICAFFIAIGIPATYSRFPLDDLNPKFLKQILLCAAAFLLGVCWAGGFAYWRMSDALPHAWEQKDIAIEGVVASTPEATERGERFKFDVEKTFTKGAIVPKHISLNQYRAFQHGGSRYSNKNVEEDLGDLNQFHAGERWSLVVRLKRPHGTVNPHGFDFESWALAENIRATGSIKSKTGLKKIDDFVWRPSYVVEHLREQVQKRIVKVLAGKPYSGIIQALVMGDDSQIDIDDWQVFLRTGT